MPLPAILLAAASDAAQQSQGLPQLNPEVFAPQLIWLAITYIFLLAALSWVILPRIGNVIEERSNRIQRDLDEAERLKQETDVAIASYEQALAEARNKATGIAKETRDKLAAETERQRDEVETQIAARLADAEKRISEMKESALAEVDTIATDTTGDIVGRLLGSDVSPEDVRRALSLN